MTVKQKKTKRTASRKKRVERKRLAVVYVAGLIDGSMSKPELAKVLAQFKKLHAQGVARQRKAVAK